MNLQMQQTRRLELSIAPMIDIVFLLLIFFLTTSQLIQTNLDLRVELPEMTAAKQLTTPGERLVLNLRANGQVVVGGQPLDDEALRARLTAALLHAAAEERPAAATVIVRADRNVSCGRVQEVCRLCQAAGVREIEIRAERPGAVVAPP